MPLRNQLCTFVAERLLNDRTASVDPAESLLERGVIDSIGLLNLIAFIEAETSVRVPESDMIPENFETVLAMEAMVDRLRGGRS
jgi:acyl carrier protein